LPVQNAKARTGTGPVLLWHRGARNKTAKEAPAIRRTASALQWIRQKQLFKTPSRFQAQPTIGHREMTDAERVL